MSVDRESHTVLRARSVLRRLVGAALVWSTQAAAQDSAAVQRAESPAISDAAVEYPMAPVVVDGATLFRVRGVTSLPAERRAADIADRIKAVAANRAIPVDSIGLQDTPQATFVVAAGRRLFAVVDADAQIEGLTRQVLAEAERQRVVEAVRAFRRDRESAVLSRGLLQALAATAAVVVVVVVLRRAVRRLRATVDRRFRAKVHDVKISTVEVVRGEQLWYVIERLVAFTGTLSMVAAVYVYLNYVLLIFPWTRGFGRNLSNVVLEPLATVGTGIVRFIPSLVFLCILALITRFVIRVAGVFFRGVAQGTINFQGMEPEWAPSLERILRFVVIAFALIIAYPYIPGSGSEAFKGIGLVVGLMFSLGSPALVGNLVAGMSLAFRRAFRVGDRVKIGEHVGEVTQVRLLTTYLRSPKNEEISIPNSAILNGEVVNYSALARDKGLILHTTVGIGYETPWRQVEAMLLESARRTSGLLSNPAPFVLQRALGDFAVTYEINAFCDSTQGLLGRYSELHRNILDVFNEYGVQIMTPAYEGDAEQPKIVPREQWFAAPAPAYFGERVVETGAPAGPADLSLTPRRDGVSQPTTGD